MILGLYYERGFTMKEMAAWDHRVAHLPDPHQGGQLSATARALSRRWLIVKATRRLTLESVMDRFGLVQVVFNSSSW
jgi:hypothetical protein